MYLISYEYVPIRKHFTGEIHRQSVKRDIVYVETEPDEFILESAKSVKEIYEDNTDVNYAEDIIVVFSVIEIASEFTEDELELLQ